MSGALWVSGGGSIDVATDEMAATIDRTGRLQQLALSSAARLLAAGATMGARLPPGHPPADVALDEVTRLRGRADDLAARLHSLHWALGASVDAYSLADRAAETLLRATADRLLYNAGLFAPVLVALLASPAGMAGLGILLGALAIQARVEGASGVLPPSLLSDARFVGLVRLLAGSADDALRGALRLPPGISEILDDDATGLVGRSAVALGLVGAISLALGRRPGAGPVEVRATGAHPTRPPTGVADALSRVPRGGSQIRIERYPLAAGGRRYFVYLEGTIDPGIGSREPNDMASNAEEEARLPDADALEAAVEAMREAGIQPDDEVELVGHSQGAMTATRIAESGDFRVTGLITAGNPDGNARVPDEIAVLGIEHSEDIVPAASGPAAFTRPEGQILVTRSVADEIEPGPESMLPAHSVDLYATTGRAVDGSEDPRVRSVTARLFDDGISGDGTATTWRARRAD